MFTYGFYNSLNGDRKYDAEQVSSIFDGIIEDGVFANVGDKLAVVPATGTAFGVIVKTGRAWFNHTWSLNDTPMPLSIPAADMYRGRYDAVVLEVDHTIDVRKNTIKVVSGTAATSPTKPTLVNTTTVKQYPLAYVYVGANVTTITEANIEITVGKAPTPFITCPLKSIPVDELFAQWNGQFTEWFNHIKAMLNDNVVTNLQAQIDANANSISAVNQSLVPISKQANESMGVGSLFSVETHYNKPITNALLCDGGFFADSAYPELANVVGVAYGGELLSDSLAAIYHVPYNSKYPVTYNADKDVFIGFNGAQLIIFKRNNVPSVVNVPNASYGITSVMSSFGDYISIKYKYNSSSHISGVYQFSTGNVTQSGSLWNHNANGRETILADFNGYVILSGYAVYVIPKSGAVTSTLHHAFGNGSSAVKIYKDGVLFNFAAHATNTYPCMSFDGASYIAFLYNDVIYLCRITSLSLTRCDVTTVTTWASATYPPHPNTNPIILTDTHIYVQNAARLYKKGRNASGNLTLLYDGAPNAPITGVFISRGSVIVTYVSKSTAILINGTSVKTSNISASIIDSAALRSGILLTESNIYNNVRIGKLKLPTITQTNAKVYIRAKTPS